MSEENKPVIDDIIDLYGDMDETPDPRERLRALQQTSYSELMSPEEVAQVQKLAADKSASDLLLD